MSAESEENTQTHDDNETTEIEFFTETEMSDETLEAVAGGSVEKPKLESAPIDEDCG
ncbi:MAG: hypothetical protein HC866_09310 [Leptolyngbyaceae cyanobacterium RU_5_1]|nr:hypothetical protein [Leptolyngbyaceae cyanobacterium RU_5_1]